MVRKQLHITGAQEAELKARAAEQGVTEAEVVRVALDSAFGLGRPMMTEAQRDALAQFLESAEHVRGALPPHGHRVYDRKASLPRRFRFITREW